MQFDLTASIVTIGPLEPALLLSLLGASLAAWFVGRGLGKLTGRIGDPWRRRLYMGPVWVVAALAFFLLPNLLVDVAYPLLHPEDRDTMVCVAMVWPTFVVPTITGAVAASRGLGGHLGAKTLRSSS